MDTDVPEILLECTKETDAYVNNELSKPRAIRTELVGPKHDFDQP